MSRPEEFVPQAHTMTGWNRSASVGATIWEGRPPDGSLSEPPTAPGSPAESDNEELEADVDYDDVR